MTKTVKFRVDEVYEMLQVYVDGRLFGEDNFWDFNFVNDAQELLEAIGVKFETEEYSVEGEDEE